MKNIRVGFTVDAKGGLAIHPAPVWISAVMVMGFLMSPVSEAKAVELFFESPIDGSLTKSRTPSVRLRLNNYQGQGDSKLALDVGGQNPSECSFDPAVGVAHCSLINPLSDGLKTINAVLTSSGDYVASATISIAVDGDEDTIPNHEDACANTPLNETVDNQGCALSQLDSDGDGISDGEEVGAGSDPENAGSYPPVVINAFAALPDRISKAGDSAGLSWVVQGATIGAIGFIAPHFSSKLWRWCHPESWGELSVCDG